jgi:hypothetical protein
MGWEGIVSCAVSYVIETAMVFFSTGTALSQIILIKLINEVIALRFVLILKRGVSEQLPLEESQYLCLMKISFVSGKVTWVGKQQPEI